MSGAELRDAAIAQQVDRNPETIAQFLNEISATRLCRLRINSPTIGVRHDEVFTVEQLMQDIQKRCKLKAGTNLFGTIGKQARDKGLITETGKWLAANRESRHSNRSPECCWQI